MPNLTKGYKYSIEVDMIKSPAFLLLCFKIVLDFKLINLKLKFLMVF